MCPRSAPTFSHGVLDDVESLGALAVASGVGLHVDNCLGGFLLSFMAKEGLLPADVRFCLGRWSVTITDNRL